MTRIPPLDVDGRPGSFTRWQRPIWQQLGSAPRLVASLRRSALARTSGVYVISNVVNSGVPFLLLPVLTRLLEPAGYGVMAMFLIATSLFEPLIGVSTNSAVSRRYFDRDAVDFPAYLTSCLALTFASVLLVSGVLLAAGSPLARAMSVPSAWLWAAMAVATGRYLVSLLLAVWQVRGEAWRYAALSFAQTFGIFVISLFFIGVLGFGWRGRALGELSALAILALFAMVVLHRQRLIGRAPRRDYVKDAFRFGGGLVPHLYGALLVAATDRFLVAQMVSVEAAGIYVVGAQVATIIVVLERSFNLAWAPWLFERLKRGRPGDLETIRRFTRLYNVVILALALGLAALAPAMLGLLVGPRFVGAAEFVVWLALGAAFTGMYKMVVNSIFYHNQTHLLAWVTFGVGAVNVPLSYLLIRWNGAVGAAQGTALSMLLSYLATLWLARRVERRAGMQVV